jgi:UDP-GlcNAc3NAcA epimerase
MKISCIVGARPQFVKVAALSRAMDEPPLIIHTGQHYCDNMSSIFFEEMKIPPPKYHFDIGGLSQGAMTGRMIEQIEKVLIKEQPDWVVVFGDTNSTLAGAIAASKLHIPIAHIEAGLRSHNRAMPEEINRVLTDHCSDLLFTPTSGATNFLVNEGVSKEKIHEVGDIMFDAALYYKGQVKEQSEKEPYVLATIHRSENTDHPERLRKIFWQLMDLAKEIQVIMPLHPRTKKCLEKIDLLQACKSALHLIDPVGHLEMVRLESGAQLIVTDSGGVQKEAFFFKIPCITMRSETEWVELVEHGFNVLVDPGKQQTLVDEYHQMVGKEYQWDLPLYGDGKTAEKILSIMG